MDVQACTKILWIITGDFSSDSDDLIKIRRALASAIKFTDGKGFPEPVDPPQGTLETKAWAGCSRAALDIIEDKLAADDPLKNSKIKITLFAPDNGEGKPNTQSPVIWPTTKSSITWPVTSTEDFSYGPVFDDLNRKVHLVCYSNIDQLKALNEPGLGSDGLYPIELRDRVPKQITPVSLQPVHAKPSLGIFVFIAAVLLGTYSMYRIYGNTELMHTNANNVLKEVSIDKTDKTIVNYKKDPITADSTEKLFIDDFFKKNSKVKTDTEASKKEAEDLEAQDLEVHARKILNCLIDVQNRLKNSSTILSAEACNNALQTTKSSSDNKNLSLMPFLWMTQFAILLLILAAGLAKRGEWFGAFVDERNRYSLSSAQQLLWTVVLFSGITVLGIFNITLLADFVRVAMQHDVESVFTFFPSMNPELWLVLGLTVVASPLISKGIRINKDKKDGTENIGSNSLEIRQVTSDLTEHRPSSNQAHFSDLFTDEKHEGANTVDVSRLQHLVITGLLLGSYFILLSEYVQNLDGIAICIALLKGTSVFSDMPPVDGTFIGLLAASHAGYLVYKVLPQQTPATRT